MACVGWYQGKCALVAGQDCAGVCESVLWSHTGRQMALTLKEKGHGGYSGSAASAHSLIGQGSCRNLQCTNSSARNYFYSVFNLSYTACYWYIKVITKDKSRLCLISLHAFSDILFLNHLGDMCELNLFSSGSLCDYFIVMTHYYKIKSNI